MTTDRITADEIAELRRLHETATPGPIPETFLYWALRHASKHDVDWFRDARGAEMDDEEANRCPRKEDAKLIAAARNALPRLLDEITAQREMLHSQFAATFAKLREELGPHLGAGGGLAEILDGISSLRASNEQLRRDYQEQSAELVAARAQRPARASTSSDTSTSTGQNAP